MIRINISEMKFGKAERYSDIFDKKIGMWASWFNESALYVIVLTEFGGGIILGRTIADGNYTIMWKNTPARKELEKFYWCELT